MAGPELAAELLEAAAASLAAGDEVVVLRFPGRQPDLERCCRTLTSLIGVLDSIEEQQV